MNSEYIYLASLPGTRGEQTWLWNRLERLSAWESAALTALTQRRPPNSAEEMVNHVLALRSCAVYLAPDGYEGLGKRALRRMAGMAMDELLPHVDLKALGMRFEDQHPGVFVEDRFVAYPSENTPVYHGRDSPLPEDEGWSVRLKLASAAVPEGVWLRLPDYQSIGQEDGSDGEITVAKDALRVQSLDECALLEAQCALAEAGVIQEQYDSIEDLVRDGNNLGFILDEQGQGAEHWRERFAAALEYEECDRLRLALDISQNLNCYEWIDSKKLREFTVNHLRSCGVSKELTASGAIHMKQYAKALLRDAGYLLTGDGSAYVTRNDRTFSYNYSMDSEIPAAPKTAQDQKGNLLPDNILDAVPALSGLTSDFSPAETLSINAIIVKALSERGPDGLRQLQTALEYEECDCLKDAVEIATHLDCYGFIDIHSFCEAAKAELLSKGIDERALCCFDYETYAALTHGFGFIHPSRNNGMWLCKTDQSFQLPKWQEKIGPTGPAM